MENTNISEIILWLLTGLIACAMIAVLSMGWLKGFFWQREMKMRKRHSHR